MSSIPDTPIIPEVTIKLTGHDSNAGAIMATVTSAIKEHYRENDLGSASRVCDEFRMDAMSGSYDDLLRTCMKWVNVE